MNNCTISLKVTEEELARRRKDWVCPPPKVKGGYWPAMQEWYRPLMKERFKNIKIDGQMKRGCLIGQQVEN